MKTYPNRCYAMQLLKLGLNYFDKSKYEYCQFIVLLTITNSKHPVPVLLDQHKFRYIRFDKEKSIIRPSEGRPL